MMCCPKTLSDMCCILAEWNNRYGSKYNCFSDVNDGIAFATTEGLGKKGKGKKKGRHMLQVLKTGALFKRV